MFIAPDKNTFQHLFITKLHQMLSPDELGAFILVLANSMQDEILKHELARELDVVFEKLEKSFFAKNTTCQSR